MTAGALVKKSFVHGWSAFTRRPWFAIGSVALVFSISIISGAIAQLASEVASTGASLVFNALDFFVVQIFVSMGIIAWSLKATENIDAVKVAHLWSPAMYWKFLGTAILVAIIEIIGFVLFVIPGIIATVFLLFASYTVIDRHLGPIEAIQRSFEIVKGHFWGVFLLLLAALAINVVGALLFGVGLLVTIPITVIAIAHAYRSLSH